MCYFFFFFFFCFICGFVFFFFFSSRRRHTRYWRDWSSDVCSSDLKVEEDGIRCCYHGWKFDTEGHCLEQPCEPDGGQFRDKVRQPWYPVQERYGLIFAYMGPAEKKPVLPRYEALEKM